MAHFIEDENNWSIDTPQYHFRGILFKTLIDNQRFELTAKEFIDGFHTVGDM